MQAIVLRVIIVSAKILIISGVAGFLSDKISGLFRPEGGTRRSENEGMYLPAHSRAMTFVMCFRKANAVKCSSPSRL